MKKSVLNIILFLSTFTKVLQSMDHGLEKESYNFDYSPTIVSGDVSTGFAENNQFQITASDGAVLEFNGFDIGSFWGGEADTPDSVRFIQPSTTAKVYNKIINEDPTAIRGNLEANGHVILINPSGFTFDLNQMSTLNVAKLHVIAGNADDDFDNYSLSGSISVGWDAWAIADNIWLAGKSVEPGSFQWLKGDVLSVTNGNTFEDATLKLVNSDNSLTVPIDSEITVEGLGAVSDLAGQAVLQTGVMLASQTQFQPTTVASTASTSSSTSDGGNEESTEESTSDSSDDSGNKANTNIVNSTVAGVAPFSQISEPILSVEASKILESALSPEVEQKMSKFLTP